MAKDITTQKDFLNLAYDAALNTIGAVAVGFAVKKITRVSLGVPETPMPIVKLAAAIAGGTLLVEFLQKEDVIPVEIKK